MANNQQQPQQVQGREVEVRSSKREKIYKWSLVVAIFFIIIMFLTNVFHVDIWFIVLAAVGLLVLLIVVMYKAPIPDMWDIWVRVRKREYKV